MAELKHTFTSGRMNKDLDERLIPNGEYIDAVNIQVSSSEGSDVGAIENVLGNEQLSRLRLQNAKTLGSIAYNLKNKLYWLVTSDAVDGIYEFDEKQKIVSPVLIDKKQTKVLNLNGAIVYSNIDGELIIDNFNNSTLKELIGNDLPIAIDEEKIVNNNISIVSYDPYIKIIIPKGTVVKKNTNEKIEFKNVIYNGKKYGNIDLKSVYTSNGILNFDKNNLITGINIVDDLLFWTDNLNQPRRINISSFKKYTNGVLDSDTQIEYAKKDPVTKQITKFKRAFTEDDISVVKKAPMYAPSMELYDSVSDGVVDINYTLNLSNIYIGQKFTLDNLTDYPDWKEGDFVTITSTDDFSIDASVIKADGSVIELSVSTITGEPQNQSYDCQIDLKQKKALYELNFVRFAYRWKYKNGEYSVISPFTEPAFIPDDFKYDGKEAFNYGMINKLQRVVLNNFDLGNDDISEIDILFKEGRNQNIYVLQTKKKLDFNNVFEITKEQIHSVIPNDQLLRAWDNVPKRAKAQEVTANRVIYGNYTQNYDVYNEPSIKSSIIARQDDLNRTIKSNRTYQIGVAYIDEYNRHTPVLSNDTGAFTVSKDNSILKNQFSLTLENQPPAWAKWFKYYIKDTSGEYYNLSADRYYQDTDNGFTYISFPSSDRNKVTNDHYLILKKNHGDNNPVLEKDNRYKIIDIFSDPPEFITNRKRVIYSLGDIVFTDDYAGSNGGNTITNRDQGGAQNGSPIEEYATFQMKKAGDGQDGGNGVPIVDAAELKPGRFIKFSFSDKESDAYEIKTVQQHPAGKNEVKVTVTEPFGDDVNVIYSKISPFNLGNDGDNLGVSINILETYSAAGDKEFDGRFFVKLKTNGVLSGSIIKETVGGKSYLAKQAIRLNGVYPVNGRDGIKFRSKDRSKNSADSSPNNPFVVAQGGTAVPGNTEETGKRIDFGGNLPYNITLEAATHRSSGQFLPLAKQIKAGDFVRFKNPDGTLHHETVYEIGAVRIDQFDRKISGTDFRRGWYRISIAFIDENAEFKPLEKDVCTRDENTTGNEPIMEILQELTEDNVLIKDPAIFETEPLESKTELDIYYETEKAIPIADHGKTHTLNWYNAISFGNGVESNRIRDDFNAIFIDTGVRASTVLAEPFKEEHKFNSIIWSGIINSRSGTNQSNQFNMANPITKDLLPSYGSVQKLFARDGDIVIYCEDKILKAFADKDILYNADGSSNLVASNRVIGDVAPFAGEYGISTNPESFAFYGFRAYNADPKRGVVLRLSRDGLTPISAANMGSYFRNTLYGINDTIIGSYDNRNKLYNLSYGGNTVCFSEDVNGWVTFKSFVPQNGVSLNNAYYSYNDGELWQHDILESFRNNFYGEQYSSKVELNINDNPSVVKKYKTLGYEGTENWKANVVTDQQSSSQLTFKEKENKYFVNITGDAQEGISIDNKNFSAQGIGKSVRKTTISFATGSVVSGKNGEIIILGAGDTGIGPDYIIKGDKITYEVDDNGDINVTGSNVNGESGTGDTTGGDTISTGGGNVNVNDTGGVGSDDNATGDQTGDFTDTGGSDTDVTNEDTYSDQLGSTAETTATLMLDLDGYFYSNAIEITQEAGKSITGATFTIFPKQGYEINAADFLSNENIVFTQDGDNVKAKLTIDINQPANDETFLYNVSGKSNKAPISTSGTVQTDLINATINNNDLNSYSVSGEYGEEKIITERIITADDGYYLTADTITVDNPNIFLEKIKLSDVSYKIIETVFIPRNTKTNDNYTILVNPLEVVLPDPKIISKTIRTELLSNIGETRDITINGEKDAEFELIFSDTSGVITRQNYKIDITGKQVIPLVFDAGDDAETYTIDINNLNGTDKDNNFGSQSITLTRNAKGRKAATFLVKYSNTINNTFSVEDYIGQGTNRQFSFDLTLPAGTYTIGKQPSSNDVVLGDNNNDAFVLLNNIEFDTVSTNVLTVSGTLFVSDFQEDETYTLNIAPFVGKDVTTTFASSVNASDGNPAGNFTIAATSYTVDGGAGLNSTPTEEEYFFTLTPSASYEFISTIDADDFVLLDSSNNDVTADYAANGELLLRKVGDTIEVGFKSKTFTQPSATSTFTLRPKVGVTLTQAEVTTNVTKYTLKVNINYTVDGVLNNTNTAVRSRTNFDSTSEVLFPIYQSLTSLSNLGTIDTTQFSNSSLFYLNNTNNTEVTLAPAGSYTNDSGNAVTTTNEFEFNSSNNSLVTNLLVDLNSDATISFNEVNVNINLNSNKSIDASGNVITKYHLVEIKLGGCAQQVNGPDENYIQWSPIDESENRYPKYYATSPTLSEDVRIYQRVSSAQPIPGNIYGFTTVDLIQKNNEKLFTVSNKNTATGLQAGWLFEKGVCSLDGSHLNISTNTIKPKLYNDVIKHSYPISSDIYKNEKQTLTGTVKITNKAAYDAIIADITSKGYNIKPVQGVDINNDTLTFTYDAYFDQNGNSTFDFETLRGADEYGLEFNFDDTNSDSSLAKVKVESYEMRRKSTDNQDSNDHIPDNVLDNYDVVNSYNTTTPLNRYSGSGFDSTSNRTTDNVPYNQSFGYTGNAQELTVIPQNVIDGNSLVQYLNGNAAASMISNNFTWTNSGASTSVHRDTYYNLYSERVRNGGPISGNVTYVKTGFTVLLEQKDVANVQQYYDLWNNINNGDITSLKIPINLVLPQTTMLENSQISTERLFKTTVDIDGGYSAQEETGWFVSYSANRLDSYWKNYYIGNENIYISETVGNGLQALPSYAGIKFTFGVTIKAIDDNNKKIAAFAELPFNIDGFKQISNLQAMTSGGGTLVYTARALSNQKSLSQGNKWDYKYHESTGRQFTTIANMMGSGAAFGLYDNKSNYIKFKTSG